MEENKIEPSAEEAKFITKNKQDLLVVILAILVGSLLCIVGYMLGNSDFSFKDLFAGKQGPRGSTEILIPRQQNQPPSGQNNVGINPPSPFNGSVVQTDEERIGLLPDTGYSLRYGSVYYEEDYLGHLDLETTVYVGGGYIKDNNNVFLNGKRLPGANPARCTKETLEQCAESLQWQSLYSPYSLEVTWNTEPVSAEEILPASYCRHEGNVVGTVKNGVLAGGTVLVQNDDICGMWCSATTPPAKASRYVNFNGYLIPVNSETGFTFSDSRLSTGDRSINNSDTDYEAESKKPVLDIPNSDYWLVNASTIGFGIDRKADDLNYLFTDPFVGPVYRSGYDCFISERPDHVQVSYRLGFDYIDDSTGVLDFTMLDGTKNTEAYGFTLSYHSCYDLVELDWLKPDERLVKVGELPNGDPVYKLAKPEDEHLVAKYEDKNTLASYDGGKNKYSYDEYLSFNPYLYWQDPFGDWVQFMNRRFESAAEKCKPVVYLYPEKTGDFSVYVKPNGGFTKTIPDYGTGWHVTATPNSQITDKKSGETYPYLYWAGINTGIPQITEGWIVEKEQTETFLVEKLAKLGLNTQEIADFNEYWIPRFQTEGADQYKMMFLPQYLFEPLAPLSVVGDETPESIIRVMMYAQPANDSDVLPEQILPPTPPRTGFTVIEWGGAMLN